MNPFEMVVLIVAIVGITSVLRARYGGGHHHRGGRVAQQAEARPDAEAERLRAEVKTLKERVAVLERLATDSSAALDREFDKLRQKD